MSVLTSQEQRVLVAVGEGWTNAEIARDLGISRHTIHTHLANVYSKLGARNRTEAVYRAVVSGHLMTPGSEIPHRGAEGLAVTPASSLREAV